MINFFRNNHPAGFVILPVLAFALWINVMIEPVISHNPGEMTLFSSWLVLYKIPQLANVIAVILIIAGAFLLNYIVNEYEILGKRSFLAALVYIVFMSISPDIQYLHPVQLANILLLFAFNALMDSYRKDSAFSNVFNAGFFTSLAVLVYMPIIFYLPMLWLSIAIIRPFVWREWFIALFGVLIPIIFLMSYYFFIDELSVFISDINMRLQLSIHNIRITDNLSIVSKSVAILFFTISMFRILNSFSGNSQKAKRAIYILLFNVFFGIGIYFFFNEYYEILPLLIAIPASVFCSHYFISAKKKAWADWWFFLLLSAVLFQQVYYLL